MYAATTNFAPLIRPNMEVQIYTRINTVILAVRKIEV